ncbi:MAG: hypothetical protein Q9209_005208 [Squamulea sp. 1 TL-2023]
MRRRLSTRGQQVQDEMKKRALEAQAYLACGEDSDSDGGDGPVHKLAPSFTKKVLPLKQLMPTIAEENQTFTVEERLTYSVTIRSNSVHTRTNTRSGTPPELFKQAELEARIAQIDDYLEQEDAVRACYRERLWRIRKAFDELKGRAIPRDVPKSWEIVNLDLEVQVAYLAQANVKRFTNLLLHANVAEEMKVRLRRCLSYSETMANPRFNKNINLVLIHLKWAAASIESGLVNTSPEKLAAIATIKQFRLERDLDELGSFLQDIFLLRYDRNQELPRLNIASLNGLGEYIRWKATGDKYTAALLAKKLGLHPIELDNVMQERLDLLLEHSDVDPDYVQARLGNLDNIWYWVNEHNPLATKGQWTKLARQFCDDRAQFQWIFPGDLKYINPEGGVSRSNTKARVHLGMMRLHCNYFAELLSPDVYQLSQYAIRIEKGRLKEMEKQQKQRGAPRRHAVSSGTRESRPSFKTNTLTRLRKWAREAKNDIQTRLKSEHPDKNR